MNQPPDVIHFACHSCGMALTVPATMAGISGPCPQCQAIITSPAATASAAISPPVVHPPAAEAPPTQLPLPRPVQSLPQPRQPVLPTPHQEQVHLPAQIPHAQEGAPQPDQAATVHPLLNQLLQTPLPNRQHQPAPSPEASVPVAAPTRRRNTEPARSSRGPIIMALIMAVFVMAGIAWFFRDPLMVAYRTYQLEHETEAEPPEIVVQPPPQPQNFAPNSAPAPAPMPAPVPSPTPSTTSSAEVAAPEKIMPAVVETKPAIVVPDTATAALQASFSPTLPTTPAPPKALAVEDDGPSTVSQPQPMASATVVPTPPPASLVEVPPPPALPTGDGAPRQPDPRRTLLNVTPETQPAVDALEKFFAAATWRERSRHVQSATELAPLMEKYYASNPDGPIQVTHITVIRLDRAPGTGGPPHCILQVSGGAVPLPLPVMVEESPDGWKVDWLTFTEFKDNLLEKFLESYVDTPQRFHVMIRRTHYFDDDIPELEKKICYEITPPVPGNHFYIFASKGSLLAKELDANLGWEVGSAAVIVELQWRKQDRYQWVELVALPQYNWRNPKPVDQSTVVNPAAANGGNSVPPPPSPPDTLQLNLKNKPRTAAP